MDESLSKTIENLGIKQIERHIFLCCDQTKPKCCSKEISIEVWEYLKTRLKELGLDQPTETNLNCIFRTKANCLRVCQQGPIIVVYPDGIWYGNVNKEVIDRIIQEHLINNQIVEEYVIVNHPLEVRSRELDKSQNSKLKTQESTEKKEEIEYKVQKSEYITLILLIFLIILVILAFFDFPI